MGLIFYIASLFPLSILIVLRTIDIKKPLEIFLDYKFYIYFVAPLLCFALYVLIILVKSKIDKRPSKKFVHIREQEVNLLIPITLYFIPFVSISFSNINDYCVLLFIVVFIGLILIKANLQYLNPIIIIFGYSLYKGFCDDKEVFILSRKKLKGDIKANYNQITEILYKINSFTELENEYK